MDALPARAAAARDVDRIVRSGAYSNVLVAQAKGLDAREHGHYQRLVYDTLRHLPALDDAIGGASSRRLGDIDPIVLAILRVAATEVLEHDTPSHAVVFEYVEAARALRRDRAAGFINAVLRSLVAQARDLEGVATEWYPPAVIEAAERSLGDQAGSFLEASNAPAPIGIRVRGVADAGDIGIPGTRYVQDVAEARALERSGDADIMDPASAAVAVALAAEPGDRVADLAASPGGKARALADAVGPEGIVVCADVHVRRTRSAAARSRDIANAHWIVADATQPAFRPASFDRVLLDAPCTGLGTMRRRPEIRLRFQPGAPSRYGDLQRTMLESAIALVRPGGRIAYSVCTITLEETKAVVADLGFMPPGGLPGTLHGDGLMLGPHITGTDGMFIAVKDL